MKTLLASLHLSVALATGFAQDNQPADLVVHEWGTFTSVQGADGKQIPWLSQIGADLPNFVYLDRNPNSIGAGYLSRSTMAKFTRYARQRMETPVLYFYSDQPMTVDVEVGFPQGFITEWFPRVSHAGPTSPKRHASRIPSKRNNDSYIRWDDVQILPRNTYATLRHDGSPSHYYPARETDANHLRIATGNGGNRRDETEKLLFYRGLGHFEAPLHLSMHADEKKLRLRNNGKEALTDLYLLVVKDDQAKIQRIDSLTKHQDIAWNPHSDLRPLKTLSAELAKSLEESLVRQGLYRKEAKAMIQTWRKSWFHEQGVRVLYTLHEKWTNQALPLNVSPRPNEIVRVMVGRAELITPTMEWSLLREVVRYSDEKQRMAAVEAAAKLNLGRFLDPVIERLIKNNPNKEFRLNAQRLQYALHHRNKQEHTVVSLPKQVDRSGS